VPISVPTATSDEPLPGPAKDQATAAERSADARLARVHLRGGLLTLARATLEGMAGSGTLDRDAMADLAEVRWRSGDLEGAADAARAHQASAGNEPLAALIIAEDMARSGHEADANPIAGSLYERVGGAVDVLFALEPRSPIWPPSDEGWMSVGAAEPGHWGLLVGGSEVANPSDQTWRLATIVQPAATAALPPVAAPSGRGATGQPGGATSTGAVVISGRLAGEELEAADQALARGDLGAATARLSVLLRLDPALAPIILSSADRAAAAATTGSRELSAIHLVRGDAYRVLGRDTEAAAAYQAAHQALDGGPLSKEPT
jgi:hypothetical protein